MLRASRWFPYLMLLPAVLVMTAVVAFPFLYDFYLAFRNMSLYHFTDHRFVGLEQFRELLRQPELYTLFGKSVIWTVVNVVFHVVFGVLLALLLNRPLRGRAIYRTLLILPWAMPQYISALTWRGMFNYEYGAVNLVLAQVLHLPPIPWLSDPFWAFLAPILCNIWLGFPFMMIVALGGLTAIPHELYEAADLDGAGSWQKFRHVTLPQLMPVLSPAVILGTVWTFNNTLVVWLVSNGGQPADRTHTLVTYIYKIAFTYYRYSFAAAFSVVVFLMLFAFVLVALKDMMPKAARS